MIWLFGVLTGLALAFHFCAGWLFVRADELRDGDADKGELERLGGRLNVASAFCAVIGVVCLSAGFAAAEPHKAVQPPEAVQPPPKYERDYVALWCDALGGEQEVRLRDGTRVDCLVRPGGRFDSGFAVEFDFDSKPYECTGQALHYGAVTGYIGVCALIRKKGTSAARWARQKKKVHAPLACVETGGWPVSCETRAAE